MVFHPFQIKSAMTEIKETKMDVTKIVKLSRITFAVLHLPANALFI